MLELVALDIHWDTFPDRERSCQVVQRGSGCLLPECREDGDELGQRNALVWARE